MFKKDNYKIVLQKTGYDCGAAATATLLLNAGIKRINYKKLGKQLKLSTRGVLSDHIVEHIFERTELKPKLKSNSKMDNLKKELKRGGVCMIMYQGWAKDHEVKNLVWGHYAVAVKILRDKIYLIDPGAYEDSGEGIGWRVMDVRDFQKRWIEKEKDKLIKGWMLSVKPLKN